MSWRFLRILRESLVIFDSHLYKKSIVLQFIASINRLYALSDLWISIRRSCDPASLAGFGEFWKNHRWYRTRFIIKNLLSFNSLHRSINATAFIRFMTSEVAGTYLKEQVGSSSQSFYQTELFGNDILNTLKFDYAVP